VTNARLWKADRAGSFYVAMAMVAIAAVATGFSTTYFIPIASGAFAGPPVAHVHGLLFMTWIALMLVQPMLVRQRRSGLHRKLGLIAIPLAAAMAVSGLGVGVFAVSRDLAAGVGGFAYSQLIGVVAAMTIFVLYVSIAVAARRKPDWHKRMMLLATIAVLWPAWFRFRHLLPFVPHPEIILAVVVSDSLVLVAMVRDRLKFGQVHPAYLIFGLLLVAEHVWEVLFFDTSTWRAVAAVIYQALV
jgi:uncharacterized membrane protein